jgi:hypothetical protein
MRLHIVASLAVGLLTLGTAACSGESPASETEPLGKTGDKPPASGSASTMSAKDYDPSLFADSAHVDNRWYPLQPGTKLVYRGSALEDGKQEAHAVVSIVTDLTKAVDGVRNIVVWERDYANGQLVEQELALFAQDRYGNVWHMGEHPEEIEEGKIVKSPTWVHGIKGAYSGVTVPGAPRVGTPDFAEGFAPPPIEWADRGRVHKTGVRTCVPTGCYDDVVVVEEFERAVPHAFQDKFSAPGVGVVRVGWRGKNDDSKETLRLVSYQKLTAAQLGAARKAALVMERRANETSKVWAQTSAAEPMS